MTLRIQAWLALTFALVLLRLARTDALLRYVRPGSRMLVLVAAVVLAALAGAVLVGIPRGTDRGPRACWLVFVPVLALIVVDPPALGALGASRIPVRAPRATSALAELPPRDPVDVLLSDVAVRALWQHGATLRGRVLRVTGFVGSRRTGGFALDRLSITCCAADAQRDEVSVRWSARVPPTGRWVTVTGRFAGLTGSDRTVPVLTALDVSEIRAPTDPYD